VAIIANFENISVRLLLLPQRLCRLWLSQRSYLIPTLTLLAGKLVVFSGNCIMFVFYVAPTQDYHSCYDTHKEC